MALFPGSKLGPYEVVALIGAGGMGEVYRARDARRNLQVAVKVLRAHTEELRYRFLRGGRSAGLLQHPNIVTVYDVGEHDSQPFIAMEYIEGQTLAQVIAEGSALSLTRKLELVEELCEGLAYAHRAGIVHRDIKPSNLMINPDGLLKILDFGIAGVADSGLTQAGAMIGTPNYMSPEQVRGQGIDLRSDVFAVGLVFYELLSSHQAFPGGSPFTVVQQILTDQPIALGSLLPGLSTGIVRIVDRALEKAPERRYQDLDLMRKDIGRARDSLSGASLEDTAIITLPHKQEDSAGPPSHPGSSKSSRRTPLREELARRRAEQIEEHLRHAETALAAGHLEEALQAAEQAVFLDADSQRTMDSLDRIRAAIDARQVREWLDQAKTELGAGALTSAESFVARAVELDPTSEDAKQLGTAVVEARHRKEREAERLRLFQSLLARANEALDKNEPAAALRAAMEALQQDPASTIAKDLHGRAEIALREYLDREAQAAIDQARKRFASGAHDEALAALASYMPEHPAVDAALAELRTELDAIRKRMAEEVAARRRAEEERRKREQALDTAFGAVVAAIGSEKFDDATARIELLAKDDGLDESRQAELERARILLAERMAPAKKRAAINRFLTEGRKQLAGGDFVKARAKVDAALALDAEDASAKKLGAEVDASRQIEEERRQAKERDDRAASAVANARRLFADGKPEGALKMLRDEDAHPAVTAALAELVEAHEALARAQAAADHALSADREDVDARALRGEIDAKIVAERRQQAREREAQQKAVRIVDLLKTAAAASSAVAALRALDELLKLDPDHAEARRLHEEQSAAAAVEHAERDANAGLQTAMARARTLIDTGHGEAAGLMLRDAAAAYGSSAALAEHQAAIDALLTRARTPQPVPRPGDATPTPQARPDETVVMYVPPNLRPPERTVPVPPPDESATLVVRRNKRPPVGRRDDNVRFTVYRPPAMAPQRWYPLLIFAHLGERRPDAAPDEPDPVAQVEATARALLGPAASKFPRIVQDGGAAIPHQALLRIVPRVPDLTFNPPELSFYWTESVHKADFRIQASASLQGRAARGSIEVRMGAISVALIAIAIPIDASAVDEKPPVPDVFQPYRRIFASYSHKDTGIVRQFENYARGIGDSYMRDVIHLRAGEIWSDRLLRMIDAADVFQLFWSNNSLDSPFVRREWEHALTVDKANFVRPLYWESPFPERPGLPPPELRARHFANVAVAEFPRSGGAGRRWRSERSDAAYRRAVDAYDSGAIDAARRFAAEALREDHSSTEARELLVKLSGRSQPTPTEVSAPPPRRLVAKLVVFRGTRPERYVDLTDRDLRIGRAPENDVILEDPDRTVSRFHAELRFENGQYALVDLNSQNGLWMDGQRLPRLTLEPGRPVSVGMFWLLLEADDQRAAAAPAPPVDRTMLASDMLPAPSAPTPISTWAESNAPPSSAATIIVAPPPVPDSSGGETRTIAVSKRAGGEKSRIGMPQKRVALARLPQIAGLVFLVTMIAPIAFFGFRWLSPSGYLLKVERPLNGTILYGALVCGTKGNLCQATVSQGELVQLQADPDDGYMLVGFTGDCKDRRGQTKMTVNRRCGALFAPKTTTTTIAVGSPPPKGPTGPGETSTSTTTVAARPNTTPIPPLPPAQGKEDIIKRVDGATEKPLPPPTLEAFAKDRIKELIGRWCKGYAALDPAAVQREYPRADVTMLARDFDQYVSISMRCPVDDKEIVVLDAAGGQATVRMVLKQVVMWKHQAKEKTREQPVTLTLARSKERSQWFIDTVVFGGKR